MLPVEPDPLPRGHTGCVLLCSACHCSVARTQPPPEPCRRPFCSPCTGTDGRCRLGCPSGVWPCCVAAAPDDWHAPRRAGLWRRRWRGSWIVHDQRANNVTVKAEVARHCDRRPKLGRGHQRRADQTCRCSLRRACCAGAVGRGDAVSRFSPAAVRHASAAAADGASTGGHAGRGRCQLVASCCRELAANVSLPLPRVL